MRNEFVPQLAWHDEIQHTHIDAISEAISSGMYV